MGAAELIAVAVFIWVAGLVVGAYYYFVLRRDLAAQRILQRRIRTGSAVPAERSRLLKDVERLSTFGPLHTVLAGDYAAAARLRQVIHHSGLKVTPGQVVMGSACLGMAVYLGVTTAWSFPPWLGLITGALAASIPYFVLRTIATRRISKFEEQFPEAVALIARTLRAGHAFTTGLRFAAEELPQPVAGEFRLLHDQESFGLPVSDALKAFAERLPIIDARFFVTAVLTQMESGGNLAEVLDNLSAVIRERFKVKRQLRVLTAHGRLTGLVLGLLPPALAVFFLVRSPEHLRVLIDEPLGHQMIAAALTLQVVGMYLIHRISNVEY